VKFGESYGAGCEEQSPRSRMSEAILPPSHFRQRENLTPDAAGVIGEHVSLSLEASTTTFR